MKGLLVPTATILTCPDIMTKCLPSQCEPEGQGYSS